MEIQKYSIGTGDRFGLQGKAQLEAIKKAAQHGVDLTIVWNKSHREHTIVGTGQQEVREEADSAVKELNWSRQYLVDADHIGMDNVESFLKSSDFFTIDVADFIGKRADDQSLERFIDHYSSYIGELSIQGMEQPTIVDAELLSAIAEKYLLATIEAGKIYHHIAQQKGDGAFVTEVSMDETIEPQTPVELFFILAALADAKIPVQTIAPKFSGRFNKGVDYIGNVEQFSQEFEEDLLVINHAVNLFNLPQNLKLSVHSGSDKFSIYPHINRLIQKYGAGIHIKTAGTTWLEELIGLAEAGGDGLDLAKRIYQAAYERYDELCSPYQSVIDIDRQALPEPSEVQGWTSQQYVSALRHDLSCPDYDVNLRQLLHVGYKVAAEMGDEYLNALKKHERIVARNVSENLFKRHINPLFLS
ncbi:MAG: hypothetical protein D6B25_15105 [Desulfobulbaceae bacterium]|nr:MAG: hypothetical protein D6B25_15105 [Desulfobulbaceae bacterium]